MNWIGTDNWKLRDLLSRAYSAWRLGQILANIAMTAGRLDAGAVWDLDDDEALRGAYELLRQHAHPMNI
jgi:hypothetical protein